MSGLERSLERNTILESWKASRLPLVWKPESMSCNEFLVSIEYPKYGAHLLGYIELEHSMKGSGGLIIPLRLSETHPLASIAAVNVEEMNKIQSHILGFPIHYSRIVRKKLLDAHDLVYIYQNFGFPVNYDKEKGFWPEPVNGFTLNFGSMITGEVSLWIYKFRSTKTKEIPFSASLDPNNSVWRESAQEFSTIINKGLPFIVHPMSIQDLPPSIKASN